MRMSAQIYTATRFAPTAPVHTMRRIIASSSSAAVSDRLHMARATCKMNAKGKAAVEDLLANQRMQRKTKGIFGSKAMMHFLNRLACRMRYSFHMTLHKHTFNWYDLNIC